MAVELTAEERAALGGSPEAQSPEVAQPEVDAPDMGVLGGVLNSIGLWDTPAPRDPVADAAEMQRKEQVRTVDGPAAFKEATGFDAPKEDPATAGFATGVLKGVFETKDFLFGDTNPADMSDFRYQIEKANEEAKEEAPIIAGVASGIGQFSSAMVGLGKIARLAKVAPAATKLGATTMETGKAAMAGFMAFDPHEERLSNLVQGTFLANPVNEWLAADDKDGVYEGRLKNALEGIGMDAALGGALLFGGKILKALKKGDTAAASRLADEFEAQQAKEIADEEASAGSTFDFPEEGPSDPQLSAVPEGPVVGGEARVSEPVPPTQAQGRSPIVAANENPGGAVSTQPTGSGANRVEVKVLGDQTPIDPTTNGFGVPKRARAQTNPSPYIKFNDEQAQSVMAKSILDVEAVDGNGGYYQALEAGHKFGDQLDTVPYHKFTTQTEIDNFIARQVDEMDEGLTSLKGGDVLTDAQVDKAVKGMVKLAGVDPGFVLGKLQQAGAGARALATNMEVGFTLAQKAWIDVYAMNQRYMLGDFTGYAGQAHMWDDILHRMSVATTFYGAARSIMANTGRAMRRMRREFMFDPGKFKDVDPAALSVMIAKTNGKVTGMKRIVDDRGIFDLIKDNFEFIRVSGLLSGPTTQIINLATSGAAMLHRPFERMVGSVILSPFRREAMGQLSRDIRQFRAMGQGVLQSYKDAGQAFMMNDSVLTPHANEWTKANKAPGGQAFDGEFFRYRATDGGDHTAINNMVYNILSVAGAAGSVPSRALGSVDELLKQTTYRSYVISRASEKAAGEGAAKGLKGKALKAYVKSEVELAAEAAFDSAGRATDANAIKEALTATFQKELGAAGKKIQGAANSTFATRFVLPFIKTPTNIIKYGARLTPGLNVLSKTVREELGGVHGVERQAQAVGQMGMGVLYLTAGSYLYGEGRFTGGGPADPKARQLLMESGWRPYAVVGENEDGSKSYHQLNRFDPFVMPMAIAADIQEHFENTEWDGTDDSMSSAAQEALIAATVAVGKQFANKSYLLGANQFLDALMDPEAKGERFLGQAAASMVPYSSLTRQLDGDEYMKDAMSIADSMRAVTPGLGEGVPHRRNWLGERVGAPGFSGAFITTGDVEPIVAEAQRLALRTGKAFGKMSYTQKEVDLRDITLKDGRTAYEALQDLTRNPRSTNRGSTLTQALNKLVNTEAYDKLPDGDATIQNSKAGMISKTLNKYREAAWKRLLQTSPEVREAFKTEQQKSMDMFREVRGLPRKTEPDQNTMGHLMDAFGLGDDDE